MNMFSETVRFGWEWLTYRADVSYDDVTYNHRLFKDKYEVSSYDQADKNYLERSLAHYTTLVWENTLTFKKQLNADNYLNAMVGQTTHQPAACQFCRAHRAAPYGAQLPNAEARHRLRRASARR